MTICELVKDYIPFEGYCRDKGLIFNGSKKAICPFHDDNNPSFHNYGMHGYCFSCGKHADIIDLQAHFKALSPWDATLSLAKEYSVPLPELSPKDKERFDRQQRAFQLIERLTTHANKRIKSHPEVREFLKSKGLDEGDIDNCRLGYVGDNNPVATHLTDETDIEIAEEIGLIHRRNNGNYRDHFRNRIIIPIPRHGKAVFLTGRAFPDSTITDNNPKYLHLKTSDLIQKEIYISENPNKDYRIIVEGVFDAIALDKAGFNACALLGTNLGEYARERLLKSKAKLYIGFDSDDAGTDGAYKLAKELRGSILNTGYERDFDELLAQYGLDRFREIIEEAKNKATCYLDAVIENEDTIEALREIAKLERESNKEYWINKLSEKLRIGKRALQRDLKAICNEAEAVAENQEPHDPLSEYTEDEKEQARELLKDPNLLNRIVKQIGRNGYIGEKVNKRVLVLSFTSRLFNEAISNIVKGKSSSGKSALVKAVLKVFPKSVYRTYTDVSSQALYRLPGLDLSHTILVIYESHGSEKADYPIRSSISEGELSKLVTESNPKTGTFEAKEIFIPAKGLCYVETTTKSQINPENQTRLFDLYIDESNEQSRAILQSKATPVNNEVIDKENRPYQALQLLLKPYDIYIPYLGILADTFPVDKVRCRRDFPRFENLIKANCLLHQEQREKTEIDGKPYLIATIGDYREAYESASVVLSQTLKEITPTQEKILQKIKEKHPEDELSMSELAKMCDCKVNTTFRTEVYDLAGTGYLEHNDEKGVKSKYRFISIPQGILKLPTPEALKKLLLEKSDPLTNTPFLKKSASLQEVMAETLVMTNTRLIPDSSDISQDKSDISHDSLFEYNSPKSLDSDPISQLVKKNEKKIFSVGTSGIAPSIQKINDETYKIEKRTKDGKPIIRIINPDCGDFAEIKEAYEQRQRPG